MSDTAEQKAGMTHAPARAMDTMALPVPSAALEAMGTIGMGPVELAVYRAVVQRGGVARDRIAEAVGLRDPVDDAVRHLIERGFLRASPEFPDHLRAVDPNLALRPRVARAVQSLEQASVLTAQLAEDYYASKRREDVVRLVDVLTGATAIREALTDLQAEATDEMLWLCKASPVVMPSPDNVEEADALARGVRYRVLYERSLLTEPGMMVNIASGLGLGETARALPTLPIRLAVADRTRAIVPLTTTLTPGQEPSAAVLHDSSLCVALVALFETLWDQATPLKRDSDRALVMPAADQPQSDADDQYLLSLLVTGVPDKAIASQLGISYRTVQRRVSTLMKLMNVETRVELAYLVGRDGTLT